MTQSNTDEPFRSIEASLSGQEMGELIRSKVKNDLPLEDRLAIEHSMKRLFRHVLIGSIVGGALGATFAFRSRLPPGLVRGLPRLARGGPLMEEAQAEAQDARGKTERLDSSLMFWGRGVILTLVGTFFGSQIGMATGSVAASKTLKKEGNAQRIADTFASIREELENSSDEKIRAWGGTPPVRSKAGQKTADDSVENQETPRDETFYERETVDDTSFDKPRDTPPDSPATPSRWEELRRSRAAQPSSWDTIRQKNERTSIPISSRSQTRQQLEDSGSEAAIEGRDRQAERRSFEELMEKERHGGDDSMQESQWKENR